VRICKFTELYRTKAVFPSYKLVTGTSFVVDGFRGEPSVPCRSFFLSHFHSDHYVGISKGFNRGIICTTQSLAHIHDFRLLGSNSTVATALYWCASEIHISACMYLLPVVLVAYMLSELSS